MEGKGAIAHPLLALISKGVSVFVFMCVRSQKVQVKKKGHSHMPLLLQFLLWIFSSSDGADSMSSVLRVKYTSTA